MDDELELYRKAGEIEQHKMETKEVVKRARIKGQEELAGMRETAMAALYSLMVHDDPSVRLKAVSLWMSKMIPSVTAEKAEEEKEVIEAGAGFDELAQRIEELKKKAGE